MADQLECYWRRRVRQKIKNELLALAAIDLVKEVLVASVVISASMFIIVCS